MSELSLYGLLFPPLLLSAAVASGMTALVRRALTARGLYRFIWHPALFDLALFVLLLAGIDAFVTN